MQSLCLAFSYLVLASASKPAPHHGHIKLVDQTASVLESAYDRLIKAAAQVEKIRGDASLLKKKKGSKAAERALVEDPKTITSDATELATQAYAVMDTKPPSWQHRPADELRAAYREILVAAEGIELVRRHAGHLAPEKVAAFVAVAQKGPEKVEKDVKNLKKDLEEAEKEMEEEVEDLEKAKAKEEKTDDKEDHAEAVAADKAADQGLAEATHEQHGGRQIVAKADGDHSEAAEHAAKKEEAKKEVNEATEEHEEADEKQEKLDKKNDKHEDKLEKAEDQHDEAKDEHKDAHEAVHGKKEKSGAQQLASYAVVLTLAMIC